MSITNTKARQLLHESKLRVTAPRLAVLHVLMKAESPLSHTEVLERLGKTSWDPATVYRNLIKLRDAGIAPVVSRADGIDRYALTGSDENQHQHPHFVCDDCGRVACLPVELTLSTKVDGPWAVSIQQAMIQFRGECPECLEP